MTTIDYTTPETAILDLDWLLDQASLFITANAIDCELEARMEEYYKDSGCPGSSERERLGSAPAALDSIRHDVRRYLACVSVSENYGLYLDSMQRLELACHKAEVERKLQRTIPGLPQQTTRKAA